MRGTQVMPSTPPIRSEKNYPMHLGCMTSTVTYGNGLRIVGTIRIKVRQRMEVLGAKKNVLGGSCVGDLLLSIRKT